MPTVIPPIEHFWELKHFEPNDNQKAAILHTKGPLFLMAGPGSGKTRVLLWRTLNLIVYHHVKPEEIFLATFTEKAAQQLQEGLRTLLGLITQETGDPYDISKMRLGTVHSICQKIIPDRDFSPLGVKNHVPVLMDELGQYFVVYRRSAWEKLCVAAGFADETPIPDDELGDINLSINDYFGGRHKSSRSRHWASQNVIGLFNRFSEESLNPDEHTPKNEMLAKLLKMYKAYLDKLTADMKVDFSLLQSAAYKQIESFPDSKNVLKHIIIDEYQDTNAIQEKIFFALAQGTHNICVVGDDDQALYRFRGATVENLVEFKERCKKYLGKEPDEIPLSINYRSKQKIVKTYSDFISLADWTKPGKKNKQYRIADKNITAKSVDTKTSVVVSEKGNKEDVAAEIAELVYNLKKHKKIDDYSQCAFLFPSLGTTKLEAYRDAFEELNNKYHLSEEEKIKIYAPRAGKFLNVEEARAVWGIFLKIFGRPHYGGSEVFGDLKDFRYWLFNCIGFADELCTDDPELENFITGRQEEIEQHQNDLEILKQVMLDNKADFKTIVDNTLLNKFINAEGLSRKAKNSINNAYFRKMYREKQESDKPYTVAFILSRTTSLDWNILDLFYMLGGFDYFQKRFNLAEKGIDEGPICNLAMVSQYLARFMDEYPSAISALWMEDMLFQHCLFSSFTFALWRLGESEYEDAEDPFPKGRISFLTIHQSKGLEFPVVVLGSPFKNERAPDLKEVVIRDLLDKKDSEPLNKIAKFDNMRMFYVALSRAQNLVVLPQFSGGSAATNEFKQLFQGNFTKISNYDINDFELKANDPSDIGKTYSYTADFLAYNWCPRQYMIMRKYGFAAGKAQTMFFGSLVHQTIEDLHYLLKDLRVEGRP